MIPFLLQPIVKGVVLLSFTGILVCSILSIQHIELGFGGYYMQVSGVFEANVRLEQRLALPSESYLIKWFDAVDAYLEIGPPVYFVVQDADVTTRPDQQKLCGRFTTCDDFSVANVLEA